MEMVTPQQKGSMMAAGSPATLDQNGGSSKPRSPGSRVLERSLVLRSNGGPPSVELIWKRLKAAGLDEETLKQKDRAALISYITKLESEVYDYQYHMGLLLLERKDWSMKYEKLEASADLAEATYKRDRAAHLTALAEARKLEESLKRALGVEKECVANVEKALHEMRADSAETKLASEQKLAEASILVENAQEMSLDAKTKLHAADALKAEATLYHSIAERKLQEVVAREDDIRRQLRSFKSEREAKEKELSIEKQNLCEREKVLQHGQERLLEGQSLLCHREDHIFQRSEDLNRLQKELQEAKTKLEQDFVALKEEKSSLSQNMDILAAREEEAVKQESLIGKKEKELLVLQEKLARKDYDEIQRLLDEHHAALELKKSKFEAELDHRRMSMEEEMETKRRSAELREADLNHKENQIQKREHELDLQLKSLLEKEEDVKKKLKSLEERDESLGSLVKETEIEKKHMLEEREQINNLKLELEMCKDSMEREKNEIVKEQEKLAISRNEKRELLDLEIKLKEEIDNFREKNLEFLAKEDELQLEKEKFETMWEQIDEKREQLRIEADRVAEERKAACKFLKEERDSLKVEKDALHDQFKHASESLCRERELFMSKMEHEHSEWFSKIQRERVDLVRDIEMQKEELENSVNMRREEIERYLKEKEEALEQEKAKELQFIRSQKDMVIKELEQVATENKKLENERKNIALDRKRREKEWFEIKSCIEELEVQREKLQKQRELLHVDREEILAQIQRLEKLEGLKVASEIMVGSEQIVLCGAKGYSSDKPKENVDGGLTPGLFSKEATDGTSPNCVPLSLFKQSPEKMVQASCEKDACNKVLKTPQNVENATLLHLGNFWNQADISVIDESKVILKVPLEGENKKNDHDLELKANTNKRDEIENEEASIKVSSGEQTRSSDCSENGSLTGKKRQERSSHNSVDVHSKLRECRKKRRQRKDTF